MNGNFYQNPTFPTNNNIATQEVPITQRENMNTPNQKLMEPNYTENILKLNIGKRVNAYVSFPNSKEEKSKMFSGIIEEATNDYIIISDSSSGYWYLIKKEYIDYVEFMEKINYSHSYY